MKKLLLSACFGALLLAGCGGKVEKPKEEPVEKEAVQEQETEEVVTFENIDAGSKATVEKLVKKYNTMVEFMKQDEEEPIEIASMSEPLTNELTVEDNGFSQTLLDADVLGYDGHYVINSKYDAEKRIMGYSLKAEGLNMLSEEGDDLVEVFTAIAALIEVLGLNIDLYEAESDKALDEDFGTHTYTDGDYTISMNFEDFLAGEISVDYNLTK